MAGEVPVPESIALGVATEDPIRTRLNAPVKSRNQLWVERHQDDHGTVNLFDKLDPATRQVIYSRRRPDRVDVGSFAAVEGESRVTLLKNISTIADQEGPLTKDAVIRFASASINLLGGEQITPNERVAELHIENPTDGMELITFQVRDGSSANIAWQDKAGNVTRRLVAGTNFAESKIGDHPAVVGSYGRTGLSPDFSSPYKKDTPEPSVDRVVLIDTQEPDSDLTPREALINVHEEFRKQPEFAEATL